MKALVPLLGFAVCAAATAQTTRAAGPPDCFMGRPSPACGTFWITEFTVLGRYNPRPAYVLGSSRTYFRWELGGMRNGANSRSALGITLIAELDETGSRLGFKPRYRRWLNEQTALDLSTGVLLRGSGDGGFRAPGLVLQGALSWRDYLGAVAQVEMLRPRSGPPDVGLYFGIRVGGAAGIISGFIVPILYLYRGLGET